MSIQSYFFLVVFFAFFAGAFFVAMDSSPPFNKSTELGMMFEGDMKPDFDMKIFIG
jgi:hypothetical protein